MLCTTTNSARFFPSPLRTRRASRARARAVLLQFRVVQLAGRVGEVRLPERPLDARERRRSVLGPVQAGVDRNRRASQRVRSASPDRGQAEVRPETPTRGLARPIKSPNHADASGRVRAARRHFGRERPQSVVHRYRTGSFVTLERLRRLRRLRRRAGVSPNSASSGATATARRACPPSRPAPARRREASSMYSARSAPRSTTSQSSVT